MIDIKALADKVRGIFKSKDLDPGLSGFSDNWKTKGPDEDEHPLVSPMDHMVTAGNFWAKGNEPPPFKDGWLQTLNCRKAPSLRAGSAITPKAIVVHTTDTMPGGYAAIVKSWTTTTGNGACAHFILGRSEADGLTQFVPVTHNGQHAGGPIHGNWKTAAGALVHPNLLSIGIEIDNGGFLKKDANGYYHPDTKRRVAPSDVFVGPSGRAWHKVTDYQFQVLEQLLKAIGSILSPIGDLKVVPDGTYEGNQVKWAAPTSQRIVGHVTLDPVNKLDPGEQVLQWLKDKGLQ